MEKLYTYLRFLLRQLPPPPEGPQYDFDDEVTLKYYKLQKISEGAILLDPEGEYPLEGPTEVGTAQKLSPEIELSKLIDQLNERFGTQFTAADQLFFDQIQESAAEQAELRQAALANPIENFRFIFDKALDGLFIDRREQNDEITDKYLRDDQFHQAVTDYLREQVYARFQAEAAEDGKA